jgi:alanine-glyoxylate transaminase/serine-glyoxylate transaminase/serine-pyruvate transaminase
VVRGLLAGVDLLLTEGLEHAYARHQRLARLTREGLRRLGFSIPASEGCASPTVTAARVPEGVSAPHLIQRLYECGLVLASGPDRASTIRVAHMGWVSEADIEQALSVIAEVLRGVRGGVA